MQFHDDSVKKCPLNIPVKSHSFTVSLTILSMKSRSHIHYVSLTILSMKSRSHIHYVHSHAFQLKHFFEYKYYVLMNIPVKPLVWVLVVPELTQTNRYPGVNVNIMAAP